MNEWVVRTTYDLDPNETAMDAWEDAIEQRGYDVTIGSIPRLRQVAVSVYVPEQDLMKATTIGHDIAVEAVGMAPIGVETITESEHERRADEPTMPELMSAAMVAEELGVARQRVHQLRSTAAFPEPLAELRGGAVWDAAAVRKFNQEWDRKPGRPVPHFVRYEQVLGAGEPLATTFGPASESQARHFFEQASTNPTMQRIKLIRGSGEGEELDSRP